MNKGLGEIFKGRPHEGELNRASAWPGFDTLLELARQSSDELG